MAIELIDKKKSVMQFYSNRVIVIDGKDYKIAKQQHKYIWFVRVFTFIFILVVGILLRLFGGLLPLPIGILMVLQLFFIYFIYKFLYYPIAYLIIPSDYESYLEPYVERIDISKKTGKGRK